MNPDTAMTQPMDTIQRIILVVRSRIATSICTNRILRKTFERLFNLVFEPGLPYVRCSLKPSHLGFQGLGNCYDVLNSARLDLSTSWPSCTFLRIWFHTPIPRSKSCSSETNCNESISSSWIFSWNCSRAHLADWHLNDQGPRGQTTCLAGS